MCFNNLTISKNPIWLFQKRYFTHLSNLSYWKPFWGHLNENFDQYCHITSNSFLMELPETLNLVIEQDVLDSIKFCSESLQFAYRTSYCYIKMSIILFQVIETLKYFKLFYRLNQFAKSFKIFKANYSGYETLNLSNWFIDGIGSQNV